MQRYKITEYTICIKKIKKSSNSRRKVQIHEFPFSGRKLRKGTILVIRLQFKQL